MAKRSAVRIRETIYSTFKGADFSTDPSLVERRRSPLCTNIVADAGGMPQKRAGWRVLHRLSGRVNGLYTAGTGAAVRKLAHVGTGLYRWDREGEAELLLTGLPDHKSRAAFLAGKLWIATGGGLYSFDGSTAERVYGSPGAYVPITTITRTPEGGGVSYEDVNMLTPYRKNAFQTDGTAVTFALDSDVDESGDVRVWVWGTETAAFTVDRAAGTVTLDQAPAAPEAGSPDGLVVQFPHTVEGYAQLIDGCTILTTYGVGTNDRLVLSGNAAFPNRDWISGLNDPSYFPDLQYATVGSENTAIMGYCRLGESLGIVKADDGKDSTVFLRTAALDQDGNPSFPLRQAIAGVGAVSPGSFQNLLDDPLFLSRTGVMAIASNAVTGERLCQGRSFYVNARLTGEPGLAEAEAVTWGGMYLLSTGAGHVYVLDGRQEKSYKSDSMGDFVYEGYYFENVPARMWLCERSGTEENLYFGTEDGRICQVNSDIEGMDRYSDDGAAIDAVWATVYDDDGTPALRKTLIKPGCCVTIKPYSRSSADIYIRSDRTAGAERPIAKKEKDILDFTDIDFERFTFNTDESPQEIFLNRKVKNYKRLQIIVRNKVLNEGFGIFKITKHYVLGNYAKR
ncbi:MAG: hypothetical protein IKQ69_06935 [Oscillospiraceae bacterium]|nr:hypothetical protein [Oscillospiraceae bacterium]